MSTQTLRAIFTLALAFFLASPASAQTVKRPDDAKPQAFASTFESLVKGGTWKNSNGLIERFSWEIPGRRIIQETVGEDTDSVEKYTYEKYIVQKYTLQSDGTTISCSKTGPLSRGKQFGLTAEMGEGFFDPRTEKIHLTRISTDMVKANEMIAEIKRSIAPNAQFANPNSNDESGYTLEILAMPDGSHVLEYVDPDGKKSLHTLKPTPAVQFEKAVANFTAKYERIVTAYERRNSPRNSEPGFWTTLLGAVATGVVIHEANKSASKGGYRPVPTYTPPASTYSSPPAAAVSSASTPSSGYSGSVNQRPHVPGVPNCLRIEAGPKGQLGGSQRIVNTCSFEVEAAWSDPGQERLSNRWSLGIGGSYPVQAGPITYNACRGNNTIVKTEGRRIWCFAPN